jgi:hypothetical protein
LAVILAGCDWAQWGSVPGHGFGNFEPAITTSSVPALVPSTVSDFPVTGQAVVTGGLVLAARDGAVAAFDAQTYGTVWTGSLPAGSTAGGVPAVDVASKTVFVVVVTASNPVLLGFDLDGVRNCNELLTCLPIFRADLGATIGAATPPLLDGGKVFANGATNLYAFDAAGQTNCASSQGTTTCTPLWSAPTGFSAAGVGPTSFGATVYDPVNTGGNFGVRAFDAASGNTLWTGPLSAAATATTTVTEHTLFTPAGADIVAFPRTGCGAATCAADFSLARKTADPAGNFLATVSIDGSKVFATNGNGSLYAWPVSGCGSASCQPTGAAVVNTPSGGSTGYSQSAPVMNGVILLTTRRVVSAANHVVLVALDQANLSEVTTWDLGAGDFAPGLASASVASGIVYVPISGRLVAIHPKPVEIASLSVSGLTLQPAFSPSVYDYTLPCAAGSNAVTINMTAVPGGSVRLVAPVTTQASGSQSDPISLAENQAAVVEATDAQGNPVQYWIRCLPSDFPRIVVTGHPAAGAPTPGWYVTSNLGFPSFATILDTNGTPVWYRRASAGAAVDVTPVRRNTVAYMSTTAAGYTTDPNGKFDVYNLETNQTAQVRTVGVPTDEHEFRVLPNGNIILLSYPFKSGVDLTGLQATPPPGPNSTIADCEIQELDPQGNLVWKWDASDHIDPVTESTRAETATVNGQTVYDVFHCNSVDVDAAGNRLVSARHLNAVFEIRRSDGKVIWKMGGKPVNKDGAQIITITNYSGSSIVMQHDARYMTSGGHVSIFDDQSFNGPAQAVEFAIDFTLGTAQPVFQFGSPHNLSSLATGSFRRYGDTHSVVGWGITSFNSTNDLLFTEVDAAGNDVLDLAFSNGNAAYRVVKAPTTRFDINVLRATAGQ